MKVRLASWLLVVGVAVAVVVGLYAWPPAALADVEGGMAAFQKGRCFNCHGRNGEGGFGPALAGRDLTPERVLRQLRTPFRNMPSFRPDQISDEDAANIFDFVASLAPAAERGAAQVVAQPTDSEVKKQWIGKGCGQCHGATGTGGFIVQNWAERGATPLAAILTRKAEGGRAMPAFRQDQVSDELETAFYGYLTGLADNTYPLAAGVTATRQGTQTTFSIMVRNNIEDAAFLEVKGVLPEGARLVDSWAGSGRGFNAGVFDGTAVGWINPTIAAERTQGPFVFIVDTGSEPATGYAWIRYITTKGAVGAYTSRPATAAAP